MPSGRRAPQASRRYGRCGCEMLLRRHGQHRTLRNVSILRQVHQDAPGADARRDAVDQRSQFVIVMDVSVEIALLLHHDFAAAGGKADEIETEAGVERIGKRIEPFAEQAVDHLTPGHRLSGIDHNRAHRSVGAEEGSFQPPCSLALLRHRCDQHRGQSREGGHDRRVCCNRLGKPLLGDVIRRHFPRTDRAIALPQRL